MFLFLGGRFCALLPFVDTRYCMRTVCKNVHLNLGTYLPNPTLHKNRKKKVHCVKNDNYKYLQKNPILLRLGLKMVGILLFNFFGNFAWHGPRNLGGGGADVSLPDSRCSHECRRGVRGILAQENFEMYSLANAISRVLRMKLFLFNAFLQVRTNCFHMIRKIARLLSRNCPTN